MNMAPAWIENLLSKTAENVGKREVLILCAGVAAGTTAIAFMLKKKDAKRQLNVQNYEKDKVYLCGIKRMKESLLLLSPYVLKLEAFLRMNNINYEYVAAKRPSIKGKYPYIEINGKEIADSNFVIGALSSKFDIQSEKHLSDQQKGAARAFEYMMDDHFVLTYAYHRYVVQSDEFYPFLLENVVDGGVVPLMMKIPGIERLMKRKIQKTFYEMGIGRHSPEEINSIGTGDIQAVADYLGEQQFMMGDKPTTVDCYVFGHMAQVMYVPLKDNPQKKFTEEKCELLAQYVERMKDTIFPDWEDLMKAAAKGEHLTRIK